MTKPRSSEAVEGDTVIIDCEVVGDPKPEVMWLRDWLKVSSTTLVFFVGVFIVVELVHINLSQ